MPPATPPAPPEREAASAPGRVFLVVVDESPEFRAALRYACRRAAKTAGHVALAYVMAPADRQVWAGVNALMRDEARRGAETMLQKFAAEVRDLSGSLAILHVREGEAREEVMRLIDEDPGISILVLGAATGPKGPGPLVSALTGKFVGRMRVPVTIVPGHLSDAEIEHIA